MNPNVKNTLAVVVGLVIGSIVNMGLIMISPMVIPPPEGVDVTNVESIKNGMEFFEAKHFIFPLLAHALGTLSGAWIAAMMAATNYFRMALFVGIFFLIGGVMNVLMMPSPLWFNITDIALAYIPMAWLGLLLSNRRNSNE